MSRFPIDVTEGSLWKEWVAKYDTPFLDLLGNMLLMFNVDWFRVFEYTQFSVNVIFSKIFKFCLDLYDLDLKIL